MTGRVGAADRRDLCGPARACRCSRSTSAPSEVLPRPSASATIPGDARSPMRRLRPTRMALNRAPLRVAVLGAGTVGREVVRGLLLNSERLSPVDGSPLVLTGIACRDLARPRGDGLPANLLTDAPAHLVAAPDTDVVVELMGGDEPARTLIRAALAAGKPVVTANKHVIAHHGPDLEAIARRTGAAFRFEAAVAGGIPLLGLLAADLAANQMTRVRGIVNGTTNYILSLMAQAGRPYAEVLADAQSRGYAEADPAGDVEGDDAVNKLVILARLAFGQWLTPASVGRRPPSVRGLGLPGITGVSDRELGGAATLGLTLKLLATAMAMATGAGAGARGIAAAVIPTAVAATGPFGWTDGVTNRIEVEAEPLGTVAFSGPGAGGAATSSAVLGDLLAIARGLSSTWAGLAPAVGPAIAAADGFQSERSWYAFVPAIQGDAVTTLRRPEFAGTADHAGGLAVRTVPMTVDAARAALAPLLIDRADLTLYPIDE